MTDLTAAQTTPKNAADYQAAIDLLLQEMLRLEAQMQIDRAEIERLRAASQAITRHTDAILEQLEKQVGTLRRVA
jgi:hypothetical protein